MNEEKIINSINISPKFVESIKNQKMDASFENKRNSSFINDNSIIELQLQ